jgi:protein-arginine kinase activator protein McsA
MGKYDNFRILKKIKARTVHICHNCGTEIMPGESYYREHIEDKFLESLHAKKYCFNCFEKYGNELLSITEPRKEERTLDEF